MSDSSNHCNRLCKAGLAPRRVAAGLFFIAALAYPLISLGQETGPSMGPVIPNYGPVYDFADAYTFEPGVVYRAVMDVADSPEDTSEPNRSIESAARFLNMTARSGSPPAELKLAIVLHGSAGKDSLNNQAYRSRFGSANPNVEMLQALHQAGVVIYLCGQTAGFRGYAASELHPAVTMATSAMTVLTRLQSEGWALLP